MDDRNYKHSTAHIMSHEHIVTKKFQFLFLTTVNENLGKTITYYNLNPKRFGILF